MMRWWDNDVFVKKRTSSEDDLLKLRTQLIRETDERIANEAVGKRKYKFRVEAETQRLERVGVTGNCSELGNWDAGHVFLLDREGDTNVWSKDILIPLLTDKYVFYRYVVVTDENYAEENPRRNEGGKVVSVRRWEANPKFRRVDPITQIFQASGSFRKDYLNMSAAEIQMMRREHDFDAKRSPEKFGTYRKDTTIWKGWLTSDNALHLKLSKGGLKFFGDKFKGQPIYAKVRALRVMDSHAADDFCEDPDEGWPVVEVSVLNTSSSHFHRQDKYGTRICGIENIIFQIFHGNSQTLGLVFDYYVYKKRYRTLEPNSDIPLHVAFSVFHPCTMPSHEGEINTDICSVRGPTIGEIKLKYFFFKNTRHNMRFKFFNSLPHEWSKLWASPQENGVTLTCSEVRENTLKCVEETANSSMYNFVEISLHSTSDGIPVFAHSSYMVVGIKNTSDYVPMEQFQVPVAKFTLHQLHRMSRMPVRECGHIMNTADGGLQQLDHNSQPFPTLMQLLNGIRKDVGFVLELKTMDCLEDGTYENCHKVGKDEVDTFINNVLKTLQQSAGKRPIILASFHPDICSLLKLKQNMYPIIFLHDGIPDKYTGYDKDFRCNHLENAISYADSMDLQGLGVNFNTFMREDNAMKIAQRKLVVYCTEEPNDAGEAQKRLVECNMNGIICTRRDTHGRMRRSFGYAIESKPRERHWIRGWAEDAEHDGYLKPEVHPIDLPRYEISEYYTKKAEHQIPAGVQQFLNDKQEHKEPPVFQMAPRGKVHLSKGSIDRIFGSSSKRSKASFADTRALKNASSSKSANKEYD